MVKTTNQMMWLVFSEDLWIFCSVDMLISMGKCGKVGQNQQD
jgi:hypothetical protein